MGRLSGLTRRGATWRRRHARLVLWGGRRYDVQVGSERDRATVRIRAMFRYPTFFRRDTPWPMVQR